MSFFSRAAPHKLTGWLRLPNQLDKSHRNVCRGARFLLDPINEIRKFYIQSFVGFEWKVVKRHFEIKIMEDDRH